MGVIKGFWQFDLEKDREILCRSIDCPHCGARPGKQCRYPSKGTGGCQYSHTPRYLAAVEAGLVPPFPV